MGGHTGAVPPTGYLCPPNENRAPPPKRGLCPEEVNRLGASGAQIEVQISVFCGLTPDFVTFFGDHLFSAGKSLAIFALHLVYLIQSGINFSCPRAPLEFTQKNFSCPPKFISAPPPPPSHAILAPGLLHNQTYTQWYRVV